jgi:hypothetical protein
VIIWPDADESGIKAALKIRNLLPHAEILRIEGREEKWDIANAVAEGIDPADFIAKCPRISNSECLVAPVESAEGEKRGKPRKSNQAMELLKQYPLCHYKDKQYMIRGNQAIQIGSRAYKDFVSKTYFSQTREPLTSVQMDEVISIHRAYAHESEERPYISGLRPHPVRDPISILRRKEYNYRS